MNSISENYEKFLESIKTCNFKKVKSNFVFQYFNTEDKYGLKPIHWACLTCNIEILDWILQGKCDIETSSRNGWRPIHFAYFIGNEEIVKYLKDKSSKKDETISDLSKVICNHEFIDEILNDNIDLKVGLSMGLKCGANCDHTFCIRFLIQPKYLNYIKQKRFQLIDPLTNQKFRFKIINKIEYERYENNKYILPKLNEILADLDHPKIMKYYGLIKREKRMILFKEWIDHPLKYILKKNKPLNNSTICRYCKDILQAIAFLHHNKILHRFIYPLNIYIDKHGVCKLALSDYTYSLADGDVQMDDEWLNANKKYSFSAPELVKTGILSYPYDIWLMGCTVIEMATGKHLEYQSIEFEDIDKMITKIPNEMLQSFIRSMVKNNPVERATANELLDHEFMKNQ